MAYLTTVAAFGFPNLPIEALLKRYRQLGCQASQFCRSPGTTIIPADVRRLTQDAGLPIESIHGLFGPDLDPSSSDEAMRRHAMATYAAEADLALALGGPMVVVHPAPIATEKSDVSPKALTARADALRRSLQELASVGTAKGVIFLIENIPPNYLFGSNAAQLAAMVREASSPQVRMCFDVGHAHMVSAVAPALDIARDVTAYLHIHDNDSTRDDHMIPGEGTIDWESLRIPMRRLLPHTPVMLELFKPPEILDAAIASGLGQKLRRWLALD